MDAKIPVLVTGGAGYIGSHAVLALSDAGWPVAVLDDLSTGRAAAVPDHVPFYRGDVADTLLLEQVFLEQGIGAIMHFAGSIVVPESVEKPLEYYENNVVKSRALIEAAVRAGIRRFIFSSTATIYGNSDVMPLHEGLPVSPINPYGWTKQMTEQMLADTARAHDLDYCALRYFNVAGADPDGRSGQATPGATHLIKVACEAALGKRDHVVVFGTDYDTKDGTGVRDYIHVSDLAAAHVLALEALMAEPGRSLTMNCGYGSGFSVLEVLDAVDRVVGAPIKRVVGTRRAGDPPTLIADPSRLKQTTGWRPQFDDLDTIVAHALQWEARLAR